MNHLWFFLFLVAAPTCVLSQVELKESGPDRMKPSQTLSLTCTVSGFSLNSYAVIWVRQAPGKGLEYVGHVWGSLDMWGKITPIYNPALRSRVSITRDDSKSQVYLTLNSLTDEDTATYWCATSYGYGYDFSDINYWGQGILVTVSSASVTSPSIFPLSLRKADSGDPVVIACLIKGFFPLGFPEPVKVTWGQSGEVTNYLPSEAGGLYTVISQLSLPADQCPDDASVKCEVQHYTSPSQSVDVPCIVCPPPPCECPLCGLPRLSLSPPAIEDLLLSSNASLTCTLRGLRDPKGATFTWSPSSGNVPVLQEPQLEPSGCYSVSSVLPGCAEPWSKKETFSCTAKHPELKESQTVSITKPKEPLFQPQVHVLPPPSEELALNELVTLTCLVRGFSPKEVLVLWLQGHEKLPREKYLVFKPLREPGQSVATFAVTSLLRVEAEAWKRGDVFSCMVGHEALPLSFTQKSIDRLSGYREPPPWVVLDPPQEDLEEDTPGASLWPTTVTLLTLFLLSLFYSTALTVTSIRAPPGGKEGPQY